MTGTQRSRSPIIRRFRQAYLRHVNGVNARQCSASREPKPSTRSLNAVSSATPTSRSRTIDGNHLEIAEPSARLRPARSAIAEVPVAGLDELASYALFAAQQLSARPQVRAVAAVSDQHLAVRPFQAVHRRRTPPAFSLEGRPPLCRVRPTGLEYGPSGMIRSVANVRKRPPARRRRPSEPSRADNRRTPRKPPP